MLDRNQLAASVLPALIASINAPAQVSQENRMRCIQAAFAWADDFIRAAQSPDADFDQAIRDPLIV
ncbi:TPA: hypothetical protein ACKR13_000272 [Pseudomonas aeruginosa]|uniref:hypothetical protein n=1 Tax=Pseudomonas aeruginosa TaxID=287 RepID=UPI000F748DBA|nr:hypothetical protein [Pseudomonas aeruginosa]EIU5573157.1 hypothetical protein [Pseudomonas aeruginosa]MCU9051234.1 hypothetical protein [Pseudomonas aeruginosa]MCU9062548.1 hypothetical protein [Pseudomonas aeruginosa]MCU9112104.1 hypothetical protein [Pseudomonas aeruginosa]MCU9125198.1 hypothetical protein [Pseudomonas aeruginosa]